MNIRCVWEHNGTDTLLYAIDAIGAYARGENLETALKKMPDEIASYFKWKGFNLLEDIEVKITEEKKSMLNIGDADSDVIFEDEKQPLSKEEYEMLKDVALKSAKDFLLLYESIPNKNRDLKKARKTFYGKVPSSATEMYEHAKNVNEYYFSEIRVDADNTGNIYECRKRGFEALENKLDFLNNTVYTGSYGEDWSLRKLIRRFIWHDRIHAKSMYRTAVLSFDKEYIKNPFYF